MATDIVAYGIYPDRVSFERTLEALRAAGFRNSDISAILPERDRTTRDLAHEINTKAPEGATAGATTGAALGGVLGWLVGIGALAIPGIGAIAAAGPVVAALAGAGAAGATGGPCGPRHRQHGLAAEQRHDRDEEPPLDATRPGAPGERSSAQGDARPGFERHS